MRAESLKWFKKLPFEIREEYANLMYQRASDSLTGREIEIIYRTIELDKDI